MNQLSQEASACGLESDTVQLNADQQAVLLRTLAEVADAAQHLADLTRRAVLGRDAASTVLGVVEYHLVDIAKLLQVPVQTQAQVAERFAALRSANERVQALEAQLGQAYTPVTLELGVKRMARSAQAAWRQRGLGHVSKFTMTEWGQCKLSLSCLLLGDFQLTHSSTPVSDKDRLAQWFTSLQSQGFVLLDEHGSRDAIVDCDASRTALHSLIHSLWPSAEVTELRSHAVGRSRTLCIREAEVFLPSLAEVLEHERLSDD